MNILLINKREFSGTGDKLKRIRFVLLKRLSLILTAAFIAFASGLTSTDADQSLTMFSIFQASAIFLVHTLARNIKWHELGSAVLILCIFINFAIYPLSHNFYLTPIYFHIPGLILTTYLLLGRNSAALASILTAILIALQAKGVFPTNLGETNLEHLVPGIIRSRFLSIILTVFFVSFIDYVARLMSSDLAKVKERSLSTKKYSTMENVASGFAQEIISPLDAAEENLTYLKDKSLRDTHLKAALNKIESAHERIAKTVKAFQSIFSDSFKIPKAINLKHNLIRFTKRLNIKQKVFIDIGEEPVANFSLDGLRLIVEVITLNASEHSPSSSKIIWKYEKNRLFCLDEGPGFLDLDFETATSPFTSSKNASGLGLFQAAVIAESLDAKIFSETIDGKNAVGIHFKALSYEGGKK